MTLIDQIDFMKALLATREESYPTRVAMKRMTPKEADKSLALTRAVLETLEKAQAAGGIARQVVGDITAVERFRILEPTLRQVQKCARTHAEECIHCDSVANVMEDVMAVVDKK